MLGGSGKSAVAAPRFAASSSARALVARAAGCLLQAPSRASRRDCEWAETLVSYVAASPESNSHRCIEVSVENETNSTRRL